MNKEEIAKLVAVQVERIEDKERREALQSFLVNPFMQTRKWNYGVAGEEYPCWVVATSSESPLMLVYCEYGFGSSYPWGIMSSKDDSLGMDSFWHLTLDDAFINSRLWDGPLPDDYEVP